MATVIEPVILSISFSNGDPSMVDIAYAEEREQSGDVGMVRNLSTYIDADPDIKEMSADIVASARDLIEAILLYQRRPPATKKSGRRDRDVEVDEDDDE